MSYPRTRSPAPPPTTAPTSAIIYTRVSTERQAAEGVGLAAQREACTRAAERLGLPVAESFSDEGISGSEGLDRRPGLAQALRRCQASGAVLIVYSLSRLARKQRLLWELLDGQSGTPLALVSATEPFETATPIGRAMLGMLAVWAQLEGDMIRSRTRDALAALKADGVRLGPTPTADADPALVRRLVRLRASGRSLRAIAEHLNEQGVTGIRGGKWWPRTVRAVLAQAGEAVPAE